MLKKVAIIGVGITPFRARYLDKTYFELAYDATKLLRYRSKEFYYSNFPLCIKRYYNR